MRRIFLFTLIAVLAFAGMPHAQNRSVWISSFALLTSATTTATGDVFKPGGTKTTFQVFGSTSAGAGSATVVIEVSNIEPPGSASSDWITMGTVTLTLSTTRTSDGFSAVVPWKNVRARVTAISGTDAAVSVRMVVGE